MPQKKLWQLRNHTGKATIVKILEEEEPQSDTQIKEVQSDTPIQQVPNQRPNASSRESDTPIEKVHQPPIKVAPQEQEASSREVKPQEQIKPQIDDTVQRQITQKINEIDCYSQSLITQNFFLRTENDQQREELRSMNENKESVMELKLRHKSAKDSAQHQTEDKIIAALEREILKKNQRIQFLENELQSFASQRQPPPTYQPKPRDKNTIVPKVEQDPEIDPQNADNSSDSSYDAADLRFGYESESSRSYDDEVDYKARYENLRSANHQLQIDLDHLAARFDEEMDEQDNIIKDLEQEIKDLKETFSAEAKSWALEKSIYENNGVLMQKHNSDLYSQLQNGLEIRRRLVEESEQTIAQLREAMFNAEQKIKEMQNKTDEMEQEIAQKEGQCAQFREALQMAQDQLTEMQNKNVEMKEELQQKQTHLNHVKRQCREKFEDLKNQKNYQIAQFKDQLAELEKTLLETESSPEMQEVLRLLAEFQAQLTQRKRTKLQSELP